MTEDSTPVDNLDAFEKEFYEAPAEEAVTETDEIETEDDSLANEEENEDVEAVEADDEDESEAEDEESDDEDEEEPKEEKKPQKRNRNSFQKRIDQLLERERLANEKAAAFEARLAAIEAAKNEVKQEEKVPTLREQLPAGAPDPDAKDASGNSLYPLGEFDPKYIQAITEFTFERKLQEATEQARMEEQRRAEEAHAQQLQAERQELQVKWQEKLDAAEETMPEIREDLVDFVENFNGIDPQYGEYLATTLMTLENGPKVLHYLSQNIGEAQEIVASGPFAATYRLGKLDAKFDKPVAETPRNKKQSKAPNPPAEQTRGRRVNTEVPADTTDLSAFEREFYKRK